MGETILTTNKLCKTFSNEGVQQHVLRNLDISFEKGDFTVIMGASGAGKSTLLYALSGMDKPTLGDIYYGNTKISGYSNDKLAVFRRRHCGFVFQQIYLLENMSVLDNVMAVGLLADKNKKEVSGRGKELLKQVGLDKNSWKKFPSQLSGGEAQRVGIVRALINKPEIVFADEPTGALNSAHGKAVLDTFTNCHQEGQSIIMVTHDLRSALRGNRIIYLKDGIICGECRLTDYDEVDQNRIGILRDFLEEMGW
ncbi:ABC transporter ATP-binding protein [Robinsoniella peoriensis]|uniref:ABC transporter ATP-binding protein n=1 Tax=Robinsoniella peoriensis TaxID=180332 RepID=UPI0005C7B34C|nr:ABC transporter ATP-binding protein [Robinsoniella peoriensis]